MPDSNLFHLNCYLLGDESYDPIPIKVYADIKIFELKNLIVNTYKQVMGDQILHPHLYQIDVSSDAEELANIEIPHKNMRLKGARRVEEFWKDPQQINEKRTQVLVEAEMARVVGQRLGLTLNRDRVDPISLVSSGIARLRLRRDQTAEAFRNAPSASAATGHQAFEQQQARDEIPIFNGRPQRRTAVPIQLFHPAFDFFTAELKKSDQLAAEDYMVVEELLLGAQDLYDVEKTRWNAMKDILSAVIGHPIEAEPITKCESDGVVIFRATKRTLKAYGVVVEVINEIGTGDCDPCIQGAQAYSRYWSQTKMNELRMASCCPSLIISIAGPWMCVSGAVYLEHVVVQPLTDYIWLGHHPQQDHRLTHLTRIFNAISATATCLQQYYAPLIKVRSGLPVDDNVGFPCFQTVQTPDGPLDFSYKERLGDPSVIRPVFEAITKDDRAIIVKFAQFYNFEAHKLLADRSLAPKLLSRDVERVGGGLLMIVMELSGTSLDNYLKSHPKLDPSTLDQVRREVETALEILHENNLVFGDLRPPNVLITKAASGVLHGQLVDFDWCGIEREAKYPVGMNQNERLGWAKGVEKGSELLKQHDTHMFKHLFP